jgi:hypothetical protein
MGVKRAKFRGNDIGFHGVMSPQGGVGTADDEEIPDAFSRNRLFQIVADFSRDGGGSLWGEGSGIGEDKENWRGVAQPQPQGVRIPAGEQQAAVDSLGAGGVIIEDNDFGFAGHVLSERDDCNFLISA